MQVLWNGEKLEEFKPGRGICQGDPLSPYLFTLWLERLLQMISVVVGQGVWKPVWLNRGGPTMSHLAFADELILFVEASMNQVRIIQTILNLFCKSSGQKVNLDKSGIFFSKNVEWQLKQQLTNELGIVAMNDLGKHLRILIFHKRTSRSTYQFILDKVNQRLSAWKARNLSFAGRDTLTKYVLQALLTYVMHSTLY